MALVTMCTYVTSRIGCLSNGSMQEDSNASIFTTSEFANELFVSE